MTETTDAMADDEMTETDDEMTETDDEMSDDEMSDDEMSDDMSDEMAAAEGDVVVVASSRDDLTILVAAIEAAGLAGTLAEGGPFTIFAPNDAAFEVYLGEMGMTAEDTLADTTFLSTLLQGHVVEAADDSTWSPAWSTCHSSASPEPNSRSPSTVTRSRSAAPRSSKPTCSPPTA